ncbi:MAG TPA: hypothetical protein PLG23_18065, partial [Thermoflexales bacterium]|nr:hypothetical protein [Thermoflexales bacterium]
DKGNVAFAGRLGGTDALYIGSNYTNVRKLTPTEGYYTYFWPGGQINNSDEIIARDYANGFRYNRIWEGALGSEGQYTLLPGGSIRSMLAYGSINDSGGVVYPYLLQNSTTIGGLAAYPSNATFGTSSAALRPVLANNGKSVLRLSDQDNAPITLLSPDLSAYTSIAGNAFAKKGRWPSVSGESEAVSFYGDFANPAGIGGGPGGGNPGEGTFISLDRAAIPGLTGGRELYRITGQACNGKLDPGEAHNDVNADGVVDPNEDAGFIFHYDIEKRVAINRNLLGDKRRMNIAFVANDVKGQAVFQSDIILPYTVSPTLPVTPTVNTYRVIGVGDVITGVNGAVKELQIGERLTKYGEVVIWIKTDAGTEAIVRAAPQMRRPVVLIPGLLGTGPQPGDTVWYRVRGLPPHALALDPILGTYDDLVQTLTNFGYQKDRDLFIVNYDWRLPPAPRDGVIDGYISNQTADAIIDGTYANGLDYLGAELKKAADAWKYFHPGEPDLDALDVIAHDAGGLIARAYIQSDAYGGPIAPGPLSDGSPGPSTLPKFRNVVLAGVPNMGDTRSWSGVIDNWRDNAVMRFLLSRLVYAEYLYVQTKETNAISGPDYAITASDLATDTVLRNRDFISRYVPTLNSMLATYPFVGSDDSGAALQGLAAITDGLKYANALLLDLNAGQGVPPASSTGIIAASLTGKLYVFAGSQTDTSLWARQRNAPTESCMAMTSNTLASVQQVRDWINAVATPDALERLQIILARIEFILSAVGVDGTAGKAAASDILPFNDFTGRCAGSGEIWSATQKSVPADASFDMRFAKRGDGTVSFGSATGPFMNAGGQPVHAKFVISEFVGIQHLPLMYDKRTQTAMLGILDIPNINPAFISTSKHKMSAAIYTQTYQSMGAFLVNEEGVFDQNLNAQQAGAVQQALQYARGIFQSSLEAQGWWSSVIFDPVDGYVTDELGRQVGYSDAEGAKNAIPDSTWIGDGAGSGVAFINGHRPMSLTVHLTGRGEPFTVDAALHGPGGFTRTVTTGTLALGATQIITLEIPPEIGAQDYEWPYMDYLTPTEAMTVALYDNLDVTMVVTDDSGAVETRLFFDVDGSGVITGSDESLVATQGLSDTFNATFWTLDGP